MLGCVPGLLPAADRGSLQSNSPVEKEMVVADSVLFPDCLQHQSDEDPDHRIFSVAVFNTSMTWASSRIIGLSTLRR
jgi:hypothetical protein